MKYRIISKFIDRAGETKKVFEVQRKILFWWFRLSYRVIRTDPNFSSGIILKFDYKTLYTQTLDEAKAMLSYYKDNFVKDYKGVKITKIIVSSFSKSYFSYLANNEINEHQIELQDLEEYIDNTLIKKLKIKEKEKIEYAE